jgi:hypothetical protein
MTDTIKKMLLLQTELKSWNNLSQEMREVEAGERKYWKLNNDICRTAAEFQGVDTSSWFQRLKIRIKPKCDLCETLNTYERCEYIREIMYRIHDGPNVDDVYKYYSQKFQDLVKSYTKDVERELLKYMRDEE